MKNLFKLFLAIAGLVGILIVLVNLLSRKKDDVDTYSDEF